METAVLDVDYLSAYLSVPQQNLTSVIDEPTADLVKSILQAITARAREHDELSADKLRADIELENAVRTAETRIEGLRATVEKAQKTVEEVRTQLKEEENSRSTLEGELQALKSTSTTSTSEVETLRARITQLEAANRDTVALLETKSTINDNLANDLQQQHQKGLQLSQQITSLQQAVQNAESAVSSSKYREQNLQQEIALAKRNNEWFENELKTKSAEALKFRKEKGARIAELQRQNEEANSNLEALKRTEQALRSRLEEVQKKAEDSLTKVQQLQEAAAKTEEGFRQELESSNRLAELRRQQTETARARIVDVEARFEQSKDEHAEELGRCRQQAESERQMREQADHRVGELEAEIDRLEGVIASQPPPSVPGTPRQGLNGSMMGRLGSPSQFGTPMSARSKTTITATQAIEELYKVKGLLATEKKSHERLRIEYDEILTRLEAKQPEMEEMQNEHDQWQREVLEMSKTLDQVQNEMGQAKKATRKAESEAATAKKETDIYRQQLRDLSAQIKMLLCDADARERGWDALGPMEREQLERLARGEISEDALEGLTDTDRLISQRLTVFRNISELQEKNQELLKITRQLGAQMESEEAQAAKNQAANDHEEVQRLLKQVEFVKDELRSMVSRSESYIQERDMFRRILQHRGQLPPNPELASMFAQSVDGSQNGLMQSVDQTPGGRENANNAIMLRELQSQFDQYREEQTVDRRTLKEQVERLSSEKVSLQAEIAKINSQLTLATERHEMLQANYLMLQNENQELQKRSQTLSEAAAKQDLRTQQVAEDLVEAKGLVESMRNENANLKAEKKLWKDIQDRLGQDNESLMNERTRLNNLIANQQNLQNERELSDSETRRRLQIQVEALETELTATKRRLNTELEDSKKAQLRKDYDSQQNQKRIDDLASSLSQVREELVAAKTSRDHLQSRVDELTIELKSAEERVEVLQPKPTPRPGAQEPASEATNGDQVEDALSKEQELAIEVSELKRDLELTKSELENSKAQMEQYKAISQASEEELQSLNATQDEYREEMDRIVEEKESKIRELQQRVDDISAELTNTNNELTGLRGQQSEIARQAEEEKATLEAEIARLKDEDEKHATAAQFHQQDLRAQAAIATKAQQDYENELVKHAEAAKQLQILRTEYNQLKTDSATLRADAESSRVALSQSESSWEERREHFERELKESRTRRGDLAAQNKLLHQQLEDVGAQISALQQSRSALAEGSQAGTPDIEATPDRTADGLRELNSFLRREKEIVEVQYELKVQEAKRLQQQLEYSQSQLDESRLKLEQERRQNADGSRSSAAHKDLMEKLQELNLFRESSITLRNEARQAQSQLAEKSKRVDELVAQIQPLETKIRELEHGKETMDGEMVLLQKDRDFWQKRTQDIISKYDRIDPADMEQLKENLESLKVERDALLAERQPMEERIQSLEADKATWQQSRQKLIDQAKERNRINTNANKDRTAERDAALADKEILQQQLAGLRQDLEVAVRERQAAEQSLASVRQELQNMKSERDLALATISQNSQTPNAPVIVSQRDPALDQEIARLQDELNKVRLEQQATNAELTSLREQLAKANSERDAAVADAAQARSNSASQVPAALTNQDSEEGQIDEPAHGEISNDERRILEERIAAAEAKAKEQEEKATRVEEQMEATVKARSEKMKTALNKKLAESKEHQRAEFEAAYHLKLEQEKQIWLAEMKTSAPPLQVATEQSKPTEETATLGTPATPSQKQAKPASALPTLSEAEIRELIQTNSVAQNIVRGNIKKLVNLETQKLQEEHAKQAVEAQEKAENAKAQAVMMETKKSALRINMAENKAKTAAGKLEVVGKAAQETPQRAVVEVWEEALKYKPPPPAPAAPAALVKAPETKPTSNGTPVLPAAGAEVKTELASANEQRPLTPANHIPGTNGHQPPLGVIVPPSNIPAAPHPNNNPPRSGIPTIRGNQNNRGRGGQQMYQPRAGGQFGAGGGAGGGGRGRGGQQNLRGSLNASAPPYSPTGPGGLKRPRDEGSMGGSQGHGGKRARGGGPN